MCSRPVCRRRGCRSRPPSRPLWTPAPARAAEAAAVPALPPTAQAATAVLPARERNAALPDQGREATARGRMPAAAGSSMAGGGSERCRRQRGQLRLPPLTRSPQPRRKPWAPATAATSTSTVTAATRATAPGMLGSTVQRALPRSTPAARSRPPRQSPGPPLRAPAGLEGPSSAPPVQMRAPVWPAWPLCPAPRTQAARPPASLAASPWASGPVAARASAPARTPCSRGPALPVARRACGALAPRRRAALARPSPPPSAPTGPSTRPRRPRTTYRPARRRLPSAMWQLPAPSGRAWRCACRQEFPASRTCTSCAAALPSTQGLSMRRARLLAPRACEASSGAWGRAWRCTPPRPRSAGARTRR
mmetsp:Transcript_12064/g.46903  ORF Transcript_12064/g.46903 Transcript_12064/m.46903 type:complete len:364 (-) Transcript_12064:75-1166(-)